MKKMYHNNSSHKWLLVAIGILFAVTLWFTDGWYPTKPSQISAPSPLTTPIKDAIDGINYSPATATDNEGINKKKEDGTIDQTPSPQLDNNSYITINRLSQNADTSVTLTAETSLTNGTCTAEFSKDSYVIVRESAVESKGTYYGCKNILIDRSAFTMEGSYIVELSVKNNAGSTARTIGEIIIR